MITSVMIDTREPKDIQKLEFSGVLKISTALDVGDLWATTDDSKVLIIERKTPEDLLGSLKDERLFQQVGAMANKRKESDIYYPYLVITGSLRYDKTGKVITARGITGWNYDSVMGGLLTVQEMGIPTIYCQEGDYENCIIRLGGRKRDSVIVPSTRPVRYLGDGAAVLLALPGIGPEMLNRIWQETNGVVAHALWMLSDPEVECSVPVGTRKRIRKILGLSEHLDMAIDLNEAGQEILKTYKTEAK